MSRETPKTAYCLDCDTLVTLRDDVKWCNRCGGDLEGCPPRSSYEQQPLATRAEDSATVTRLEGDVAELTAKLDAMADQSRIVATLSAQLDALLAAKADEKKAAAAAAAPTPAAPPAQT